MTQGEFTSLAVQMRSELWHIGHRFFNDEDTAEDVAQEALMRLWTMRDRVGQSDFRPLAIRIAKNVCISMWRKRQAATSVGLEAVALADTHSSTAHIEEAENEQRLQRAIDSLQRMEARIFRMWSEQEMDIQQIAAFTGAKPRTVSSMLSAARKKIYAQLTKNHTL